MFPINLSMVLDVLTNAFIKKVRVFAACYTAYQAYNNNSFTFPDTTNASSVRILKYLASLPTGWADDNNHAPPFQYTDAVLKSATNATVNEFSTFMQHSL